MVCSYGFIARAAMEEEIAGSRPRAGGLITSNRCLLAENFRKGNFRGNAVAPLLCFLFWVSVMDGYRVTHVVVKNIELTAVAARQRANKHYPEGIIYPAVIHQVEVLLEKMPHVQNDMAVLTIGGKPVGQYHSCEGGMTFPVYTATDLAKFYNQPVSFFWHGKTLPNDVNFPDLSKRLTTGVGDQGSSRDV